ncbi:hypothetical protein KIPB_006301 [Kipferlia bialata]|uniref:Uncharacterized protein n=1 Tax=Kipferlia bialata TaxID=797122 RepID=A0A9K3GJM9_9EUKA|nr:hypothetical protein KIPB_006301 [Kipferlia bialata]|eukprot:g6301.t1
MYSMGVSLCSKAVFLGSMVQMSTKLVSNYFKIAYPSTANGMAARRASVALDVIHIIPPSIQPLLIMYIYQASWKSVLQPSSYSKFQRVHTRVIVTLTSLIVIGLLAFLVVGIQDPTVYDTGSVLLYTVYAFNVVAYVLECTSMTVLWAKSLKFRRLLPPSHQPTVCGVRLVKIDAILVISYILAVLIAWQDYNSSAIIRIEMNEANLDDFATMWLRYQNVNAVYAILNPIGLLLMCNLALIWDKRPQWLRRDSSAKRDVEGGDEMFL